MKRCSKCTKTKQLSEFYRDKRASDGLYSSCRICFTEVNKRARTRRPPEYDVWINMKQRCFNSKNPEFKNYGARGIEVCERWKKSFAHFQARP